VLAGDPARCQRHGGSVAASDAMATGFLGFLLNTAADLLLGRRTNPGEPMTMSARLLSLFLLPCFAPLTSCNTMGGAAAMWDELRSGSPKLAANGRAVVDRPIRIGIAPPLATTSEAFSRSYGTQFSTWREDEREAVRRWGQKFVQHEFIEEVVFLPGLLLGTDAENDVATALRAAGRSAGVDAILVVHALSDIGRHPNLLAVLDLTIVGMFVFPGHEQESVTVAEALVLDVATGGIYAMAAAEGRTSRTSALAYVDTERVRHDSRLAALEKVGAALYDEIEGQASKVRAAERAARRTQHAAKSSAGGR
jgi:rhombotail lipoprotein